MRAGARLDADDEARVDQAAALDALCVLGRDEIVGDHRDAQPGARHQRQQPLDQPRLARSDRPADPDPRRAVHIT